MIIIIMIMIITIMIGARTGLLCNTPSPPTRVSISEGLTQANS